jgi:cysteine desulfurase
MGEAARRALDWLKTEEWTTMARLRDDFEKGLLAQVEDSAVNGADAPRLWNTSNIGFRRLEAEAILLLLSERGVYASAGAACSSGSLDPSPVLLSMGVPPDWAHGSIRFSLSRLTTQGELDQARRVIAECVARLRGSVTVG